MEQPLVRTPRVWVTFFLLLVLMSFVGCGPQDQPNEQASPEVANSKGKRLYDRVCATCHGRQAEGVPGLGKGLQSNVFTRERSDDELVEFLRVGRSASDPLNTTGVNMPPKGGDPTLDDEDLQAIVTYLRSL